MSESSPEKTPVRLIVDTIRNEETRLRQCYSILQYQSFLGFSIMLLSLGGMITSAIFYYHDYIPAWLCIILSAIFASIAHELEHDLIHRLYFRKNILMQNIMLLIVWLMRPNTINPWYRRTIHLQHHQLSGTNQDLEERLVGNGINNVFLRLIVIVDGLLGLLLTRNTLTKEVKHFKFFKVFNAAFPLGQLYFLLLYSFIAIHIARFFTIIEFSEQLITYISILNYLVVILIAPNFLRSACLNFVTAHIHYYGNVNNTLEQTQVFSSKLMWPFNLFCFNFSNTHAIHHIVVEQPFYLRQMVAKVAYKVMITHGVKVNDFSTFTHANRHQ